MVLKIVKEYESGVSEVFTMNTDAKHGRYKFNSIKIADASHYPLKHVENGYQYETVIVYGGKYRKCITTVTLVRGWV